VKRSVDAGQLLGMLHKQSSHSLAPAWFSWPGAGAASWHCSGVAARRRWTGQGPRREREDTMRCHRCHDKRGASRYPVTSASLLLQSRLMLDDSGARSGQRTRAVIGLGVRVVFERRIREGAEADLVEISIVEQQYRAVGGEGQKFCCGRCGAMLGCHGRRYTPCLPIIWLLFFRFTAALTHGGQQVHAMGVWS
jgi:hypothetical protein